MFLQEALARHPCTAVTSTSTAMRKAAQPLPGEEFPNAKPETEWKKELTGTEYRMLRQQGTEAPGRGEYHTFFPQEGFFGCRACKFPLYSSTSKFKDCASRRALKSASQRCSCPDGFANLFLFILCARIQCILCARLQVVGTLSTSVTTTVTSAMLA